LERITILHLHFGRQNTKFTNPIYIEDISFGDFVKFIFLLRICFAGFVNLQDELLNSFSALVILQDKPYYSLLISIFAYLNNDKEKVMADTSSIGTLFSFS